MAVLAHPFLHLDEAGLEQFLTEAVPCGLDAMEVYYPKFTPEQEACAGRLAERFGIAPSGGSDFHGENKPDTRMGTGRGTLCVPYSILQEIISRKIAK